MSYGRFVRLLAGICASLMITPAMAGKVSIARSAGPVRLSSTPSRIALRVRPANRFHGSCVLTLRGISARAPVGALYQIWIGASGAAQFHVGTLSFFNVAGGSQETLQFSLPEEMCKARTTLFAEFIPTGKLYMASTPQIHAVEIELSSL
jgi:hypothetical protein